MDAKLIIGILLTMCGACVAQEAGVETLLAQVDPAIQARIAEVRDALNQSARDGKGESENRRIIAALDEAVADKHQLVRQLAIFAAGPEEEQALMAFTILLRLELPPNIVIEVLAPYVNVGSIKVRTFAQSWFQNHDSCGDRVPREALTYKDYLRYIRRQQNTNQEVPEPFIEYLYDRSPGQALITFNQAAQSLPSREEAPIREILLAEHIVSNAIWLKQKQFDQEFQKDLPEAKEQLAKLAEYKQWWVRRYVVEIMRRHRELRQDDVLKKLETDDHALISKSAKSIAG